MSSTLILIGITSLIALGTATSFVLFAPEFGDRSKSFSATRMAASPNYSKGVFLNTEDKPMGLNFNWKRTLKRLTTDYNGTPKESLPIRTHEASSFNAIEGKTKVTWFGHSTMLLEIDGKKLLMDPMLGGYAGPLDWISPQRFTQKLPLSAKQLPQLDAVLISHDHYDHLDHSTITEIKNKVGMFFVPLGVGSHLAAWGVDKDKITELDWWDETTYKDIFIALTPAHHFSGRNLNDKNSTLWGSWVVKSPSSSVYFSGDSGYGKHFAKIGQKYGPFDITLMECGQYDEQWPNVHMSPEQSIQAHIDLKGKLYMPMHWSSFKIALHPWDEPIERALQEASKQGIQTATPLIGQSISPDRNMTYTAWWRNIESPHPKTSTKTAAVTP